MKNGKSWCAFVTLRMPWLTTSEQKKKHERRKIWKKAKQIRIPIAVGYKWYLVDVSKTFVFIVILFRCVCVCVRLRAYFFFYSIFLYPPKWKYLLIWRSSCGFCFITHVHMTFIQFKRMNILWFFNALFWDFLVFVHIRMCVCMSFILFNSIYVKWLCVSLNGEVYSKIICCEFDKNKNGNFRFLKNWRKFLLSLSASYGIELFHFIHRNNEKPKYWERNKSKATQNGLNNQYSIRNQSNWIFLFSIFVYFLFYS